MTLLLDTNILSELRKGMRMDARVAVWARDLTADRVWISAITVLEIEVGVALVERRDSRQGVALREWFTRDVLEAFDRRILPVDVAVVRRTAGLHVPDRAPYADALIAATAQVHGLTVVSRNERDFARLGVDVINPFAS